MSVTDEARAYDGLQRLGLTVCQAQLDSGIYCMAYNIIDQLVRVTRGPPGSEAVLGDYDYDANGQRVRQEALGAQSESYYAGRQLLQRRVSGTPQSYVHWSPSGRLLAVTPTSSQPQYQHTDVLGSPVAATDNAGAAISTSRYGAFGNVRARQDDPSASTPPTHYFGHTGHQYDDTTELVYANARYYTPGVGRFLTQDSFLGLSSGPGTLHRYLYAKHSPYVLVDPSGNNYFTEKLREKLTKPFVQFAEKEIELLHQSVERHRAENGGTLTRHQHVTALLFSTLAGGVSLVAKTADAITEQTDVSLDFHLQFLTENARKRTDKRIEEAKQRALFIVMHPDKGELAGDFVIQANAAAVGAVSTTEKAIVEADVKSAATVAEVTIGLAVARYLGRGKGKGKKERRSGDQEVDADDRKHNRDADPVEPATNQRRPFELLSDDDVKRIQAIRTAERIGKKRNIAVADGHVDGTDLSATGVSGERTPGVGPPQQRRFTTSEVNGFSREFDSEALALERIAERLSPDSKGVIRLISERAVCKSCSSVIAQFEEAFPGIKVIVRGGSE